GHRSVLAVLRFSSAPLARAADGTICAASAEYGDVGHAVLIEPRTHRTRDLGKLRNIVLGPSALVWSVPGPPPDDPVYAQLQVRPLHGGATRTFGVRHEDIHYARWLDAT